MLSAAVSSSEVLMARRVWSIVVAVWAMAAASRLSVLALPGDRSAMRRIDSPGRQPTISPMSWATATARAPIVAG